MEALRIQATVPQDGILEVSGLNAGEHVEVIVLRESPTGALRRRKGGWLKGKIEILEGFDDPIPGMEEHV